MKMIQSCVGHTIQYYNLFKQKMKAHSPTHQHDKKSIFEFLPGPIKIKDGLFIGDQIAARDIEFIISNKVTHIINTVSKQIPNLWQRFGIHYLSVNWTEKQQNIFDKKNNAVNTIFHFIEEAMQQGESCLIHSVNGKSRSCAVLVAYLMKKYAWSLNKSLEFISSKKQNLEIRNNYLVQMQQLEQRMIQIYNLTSQWNYSNNEEDLVLRNTFVNSKQSSNLQKSELTEKKTKKKVSWGEKPIIITKPMQQKTLTSFKQKPKGEIPIKSILKGDPGPQTANINQEKQDFDQFDELEPSKMRAEGNLINNINGNIVHVTVNNFITSEKKPENQAKSAVNTRPYSSDQKDREKQKKIINQKKILPYDTNPLISFKSPYDNKLGTAVRAGSQNKAAIKTKEEKDTKTALLTYERPQSAKNRSAGNPIKPKDELVITNGLSNVYNLNKKRYPSNSREDFFKKR